MKHYRGKLGNSETYLLIVECPFCFQQTSEKYFQFFLLTSLSYNTLTLLIPMCYAFSAPLHSFWTPCNSTQSTSGTRIRLVLGPSVMKSYLWDSLSRFFSCLCNRHIPSFVSLSEIMFLRSFSNKTKGNICNTWRHSINLFRLN